MSSSRAGGVAQAPHALALRGGDRLPSFAVNLLVEQDMNKEKDEMTMKVFGEVANVIDPDIEVEIDFPSQHPSKMLAILDMEIGDGHAG